MCGIVGLFLKDKSLEPQLGAMLSDMLVSLSDRGPDSAGIAIYGAPSGNAGQDHHPVGRRRSAISRGLDAELGKAIGAPVSVAVKIDARRGRRCQPTRSTRRARPSSRCGPASASWAPARSSRSTRRSACRRTVVDRFDVAQHGRHARHRPYPHGDGIGGDDDGRASVLDRRRPVPGAQRLAVQPQQCAPRADPRGHDIRDRERHRGRRRLSLVEDGARQESRRGAGRQRSSDLDGFFTFVVGTKNGFGVRARSDRLQAGRDGRDRPVCRLRLGIPRARQPARHRRPPGSGSRSPQPSISGSIEIMPATKPPRRSARGSQAIADLRSRRDVAARAQPGAARSRPRLQRDRLGGRSTRRAAMRSPSASTSRSPSMCAAASATIAAA